MCELNEAQLICERLSLGTRVADHFRVDMRTHYTVGGHDHELVAIEYTQVLECIAKRTEVKKLTLETFSMHHIEQVFLLFQPKQLDELTIVAHFLPTLSDEMLDPTLQVPTQSLKFGLVNLWANTEYQEEQDRAPLNTWRPRPFFA